ncbi:MAG: zinc-dependent metalloprotease [Planctomycetota bacterium]
MMTTNAQESGVPTITEKVARMEKHSGFFTFYWDTQKGQFWLEIEHWETEFLYVNYLATGVGPNELGLDRGQLSRTHLVKFVRTGPKVLLLQPNYTFRALNSNTEEQQAVEESFAPSVLWGGTVEAEEEGRVLVDATSFYLQDIRDIVELFKLKNLGTYKLDPTRSTFYLPRTKNFPQNTEVEVLLTLTGTPTLNSLVAGIVPTPEAISVRQHHSFVQLPDANYEPRPFDSRAGFFGFSFMDFSTPFEESITQRFILRHRLKKKNPQEALSEAVKPIVYYVDRGIPEPLRSAVIEGAQWWNQAFEKAGYKNAFKVELLPENADPHDIRYNMIQWAPRTSRGWSYGLSVIDPRTGEILKGHVILDALRARQDFLIASGIIPPYGENTAVLQQLKEMTLARIRQLSAHEVGHSLGLRHNFAASVNDRASVMDYPHPWIQMHHDESLDLSKAYAIGIGQWDSFAIAYGYQEFPSGGNSKKELQHLIQQRIDQGFHYITDTDAQSGTHPLAHLWDNGVNATDELLRLLKIRARILQEFSEKNLPPETPLCLLEEVFVPMYLLHRYQVEAAAKSLGGISYNYKIRGDSQPPAEIVHPQEQLRALEALFTTLKPEVLAISERILQLIPPRGDEYPRSGETFPNRTGLPLDAFSAIECAANHTLRFIFHPERAARLIEYHTRDVKNPGFDEVLNKLVGVTWKAPRATSRFHEEIQCIVERLVLDHLMAIVTDPKSSSQIQSTSWLILEELENWLEEQTRKTQSQSQKAHYLFSISRLQRFLKDPSEVTLPKPLEMPMGAPIGCGCCQF